MPRRFPFPLLALAAFGALGLSACSSMPGDRRPVGYAAELDALRASCAARNGILSPTGDVTGGRPQTDYVCEIRGATRLRN